MIGKKWVVIVLLIVLMAEAVLGQTEADSTEVFPQKVKYRGTVEHLAALPGKLVYVPFFIVFYTTRQVAEAIWEKRALDRIEGWLTTADGRAGIRPLSSTSIGSGVRLFHKQFVFGADANLTSTLGKGSGRQQHLFSLGWKKGEVRGGDFVVIAHFRREPKESFHGVGNNSGIADKTSFAQEDLYVKLSYGRRLGPRLDIDTELDYHAIDIGVGKSREAPPTQSAYAAAQLPGLGEAVRFIKAATVVRAQIVDVPGSPTRGNRSYARLRYDRALGEAFSHFNILITSEQFMELFYRRILALRLGSEWSFAPGNDVVPFYGLASLGGEEILRGYQRGRFRDRGSVFAALTYKFPVWRVVDGTLFYEGGRALRDPGDFTLSRWHGTFGGSLRAWVPQGLVFEQVIARSSEATRLLFNFKTVF